MSGSMSRLEFPEGDTDGERAKVAQRSSLFEHGEMTVAPKLPLRDLVVFQAPMR